MKVLVTGASKGIGKAIALKLAAQYELILHASSEENLDALWLELPNPERHSRLCADFSNPEALGDFCRQLKKLHSQSLYAVVNNAGIALDKPLLFQPETEIDAMIQVNLKAPILISKTAFKMFHSRKTGVILNISSCVGETGNAFQGIYAATKAGLVAFTKSISKEAGALLHEHNLRILAISPGFIETSMTERIPAADKDRYLRQIPSGRYGKPEEVAALVAFLLSENAAYINGSEIKINGGLI
ncbi:MAG: SDR family NAD(P)-dependent oxidoreductase [Bacteroidota bacterium]